MKKYLLYKVGYYLNLIIIFIIHIIWMFNTKIILNLLSLIAKMVIVILYVYLILYYYFYY